VLGQQLELGQRKAGELGKVGERLRVLGRPLDDQLGPGHGQDCK
jgi:hypothetical protein